MPKPNSVFPTRRSNPSPANAYDAAVATQGRNYDDLMKQWDMLSPLDTILQDENYFQSPEELDLVNQLRTDTTTGGYSDSDIGNIRARSISPIRAVYANAQRNAARATRLAGGYSPNAGAVQTKLAREQSEQIGNASTNVEGNIAEMRARGRESAQSRLAPLAARESDAINRIREANIAEQRRIAGFNQQLPLMALQGKTSLYGTNPALVNTFGQQALQQRGQDISAGLPIIRKRGAGASGGYGGR